MSCLSDQTEDSIDYEKLKEIVITLDSRFLYIESSTYSRNIDFNALR